MLKLSPLLILALALLLGAPYSAFATNVIFDNPNNDTVVVYTGPDSRLNVSWHFDGPAPDENLYQPRGFRIYDGTTYITLIGPLFGTVDSNPEVPLGELEGLQPKGTSVRYRLWLGFRTDTVPVQTIEGWSDEFFISVP
ncbi:hypothetical protein C8T65DRAFT_827136 [Cerioporus squamosus]|nr:hypothetical protein C8T65DRAFT_827136 [Cerioporus squamosus]